MSHRYTSFGSKANDDFEIVYGRTGGNSIWLFNIILVPVQSGLAIVWAPSTVVKGRSLACLGTGCIVEPASML